MMLIPVSPKARKRSHRIPPPPLQRPVLVNASFDSGNLVLTFDRVVSCDAFVPESIVVNDGSDTLFTWHATEADVVGGIVVEVSMISVGPSTSAQTLLHASGGNGIVAGEGMWTGSANLHLPYN